MHEKVTRDHRNVVKNSNSSYVSEHSSSAATGDEVFRDPFNAIDIINTKIIAVMHKRNYLIIKNRL